MATKKRARKTTRPSQESPQVIPLPEPSSPPIVDPGDSQVPSVAFLEPDPLHPTLAVSYVLGAQRVLDFTQRYPTEVSPESFTRGAMARVCMQDPHIKLILVVESNTGEVLGHLLATIETNGTDTWVFCWQVEVDQRATGIVQQLIDYATPWARSRGATSVLMATHLAPEFWQRRYGFEMVRHVMRRTL